MSQLLQMPLNIGVGTRTHTLTYDVLRRPLSVSVETTEAGGPLTRTFSYSYDDANHSYTRTGPDNLATTVSLNGAGRPQAILRDPPPGAPEMFASFFYQPNGNLEHIDYVNGARVQYSYDWHRLSSIEHLRVLTGERILRMDYSYNARDLPTQIIEYGPGLPGAPPEAQTSFSYDRRSRLTRKTRVYYPNPGDATKNYDLEYSYDKGGNRTVKIDHFNDQRVEYHYDVNASNPALYGSFNNRLMWYETIDTGPLGGTVSKTYYVYEYDSTHEHAGLTDGNPTRIITEYPPEKNQQQNMMAGGGGEELSSTAAPAVEVSPLPSGEGWGEGGALMGPGGPGGPPGAVGRPVNWARPATRPSASATRPTAGR